jgi:putative PIN family toxin of toxin-antitoxin system
VRVVVDTNVLASALIRRQGVTGQVLRYLRDGRFTLIYSVPLLIELVEVLSRPYIQEKYHIQSDDITALINLIRLRGELVSPKRKIDASRDPKDNHILEAIVEGNADVVVTGDKDLLDMKDFESIPIIRVAEFLARF